MLAYFMGVGVAIWGIGAAKRVVPHVRCVPSKQMVAKMRQKCVFCFTFTTFTCPQPHSTAPQPACDDHRNTSLTYNKTLRL